MQGLIEVKIENYQGQNTVSSRVIAEQLGKRHDHVIRDLEKILETSNVGSLIKSSTYKVEGQTREYKQYLLTKDGFIMYMFNIQGYNDFKMAYINKFNEMENKLKNPLQALLNLTKEELVGNVLQLAQIVKEKDEIIEQQKPAVEFTSRLLKSKDNILVREYAKILQDEGFEMGEKKLYSWLRENKYLNKNNEPYQAYMKYFVVVEKTINTPFAVKTVFTTKITPAGQVYFWSKLNNAKEIKELENKYEELSPF